MDPVTLSMSRRYSNAIAGINPAVDIVYESGYRPSTSDLDVFANNIRTDSGHEWEAAQRDGSVARLRYVNGILTASASVADGRLAVCLVKGFKAVKPYLHIDFRNVGVIATTRYIYLKYVDALNWLACCPDNYRMQIRVSVGGVITNLAEFHVPAEKAIAVTYNRQALRCSIRRVHSLASPSLHAMTYDDGFIREVIPLSDEAWAAVGGEAQIGVSGLSGMQIYNLRAGYVD